LANRHLIVLGHISGAHGLKGEVKLRSFTQDPLAIARYGPLEVEGGGRPVIIVKLRPVKSSLIATLAGVTDRAAAEALRGLKLYVARSRLPEPQAGTCYHADLIGLDVETSAGNVLGRVGKIANYGAGDLLDVEVDGEAETLLIPLIGARVDMSAGKITVDLPEGYLDKE
jgi:16S rRNA processing protein RimM